MLAKVLTVAILALLCVGGLIVTGASYAGHAVPTTVEQPR